MTKFNPPFRADHVGSLLRPAAIKEAREKHAAGTIDDDALAAVEDREIERVIKKQQEIGLQAVTDGAVTPAALAVSTSRFTTRPPGPDPSTSFRSTPISSNTFSTA